MDRLNILLLPHWPAWIVIISLDSLLELGNPGDHDSILSVYLPGHYRDICFGCEDLLFAMLYLSKLAVSINALKCYFSKSLVVSTRRAFCGVDRAPQDHASGYQILPSSTRQRCCSFISQCGLDFQLVLLSITVVDRYSTARSTASIHLLSAS